MMDESIKYQDGDVVWVKLLYCWWPGEVLSLDKVPAEVRESFKQPPLAVVRFFQEDTFEYVTSANAKNICLYTSEKKHDHIKRGMDLVRSKAKTALMAKFPADVCTAERLTGGNPNILNESIAEQPRVNPTSLIFNSGSSSGPLKRRNSSSGGSVRGRGKGKGGSRRNGRGRGGRMSTGSLDNKFFSTSSPKKSKPNKEIIVTHPRFINDDIDDHEIVELIQTKQPAIESPIADIFFVCNICAFKTTRADVLIMHHETHSYKPMKRKITSPKKPRKTYKMPKSKTKTIEEDIALVRSGKTVEDFLSDEEAPVKRTKKTKTASKISKVKKEEKVEIVKDLKKEQVKKIDRDQLVAEWNEIEESENESAEHNDTNAEEKKSNINDAIKSCFDFDDDSEEFLTTVESRKTATVIPEIERSQSPKVEPMPETNIAVNVESAQAQVPNQITEEVSQADVAVPVETECVVNKSLATEEVDLGLDSIESILQETSVPKLPEVPQLSEKCEQNFRDTRTIKFPDKSDPEPVLIDKQESNGFVAKLASEVMPTSESCDVTMSIIVPVKTEVATKLTNPKKRFVRSFQEEKAKVQDRLDKLEQEKLARENAQGNDKESTPKEIPKEEHCSEKKIVDFPQIDCQTEERKHVIVEKKHRHSSKKIERKSKYKSKRRGPCRKPEIIADIVNSFMDDDLDENNDIHISKPESPTDSTNVINDIKSNDEKLNDTPAAIIDNNEISAEIARLTPENTFQNELSIESTEEHPTESILEVPTHAVIDVLQEQNMHKQDPNELTQQSEEVLLQPEEVTPQPEEVTPQPDVSPEPEVIRQPAELTPQSEEVTLQTEEVTLQTVEVPPQRDEVPPQPEDVTPQRDEFTEQSEEVPQQPIREINREPIEEIPQQPLLRMPDEKSNNKIEYPELINNLEKKSKESAFATGSNVNEMTTTDSNAMETEDTKVIRKKRVPKPRTKEILVLYESNALALAEEKKNSESENEYCTSFPSSLPESPKSEEVPSINNSHEIDTKKEDIEEPETCKIIQEVDTEIEKYMGENNGVCASEIHEASILINTGSYNSICSKELSALNTLVTLSEMIQPEFDVRTLRKEDNLLNAFESTKDNSGNLSEIAEENAATELLQNPMEVIDIATASETNDPVSELNIEAPKDIQKVSDILENLPNIPEKVPELNETIPEVLDKIIVFPDEQLVKGQVEIVTLSSSDPMSNENSKTDVDLENVSIIADTKNVESKSFIVHSPDIITDFNELTTESEFELTKEKTESSSAIKTMDKVEFLQSAVKDKVNTIDKNQIPSSIKVDCVTLSPNEENYLPTKKTYVPIEIPIPQEIRTPLPSPVTSIKKKHQAIENIPVNRNVESSAMVSHSDTLATAIANTIESEMAKLTDTAVDVPTLLIQQKETSNSKLLEILSESKCIAEKSKRSQILQQQLEGQKKQILLNRTGLSGVSKPANKTIILSDQVIKAGRNETDSVVVQKVTNKRILEDIEDIDAYIIQKPNKKLVLKPESDITPPAPKLMKKSSPRSRPRILQQTIITAAGDVIQPDGQQMDDQSMFDINSMPIVLSDQILTPESIEIIPMILQDSSLKPKVVQTIKTTSQTVKLLNKTPTESVIKCSTKALIRGYHKAPQRTATVVQKKGVSTTPTTQVKTNYILVPSTASTTAVSVSGNRKTTIKRQGSQIVLQTAKPATPTTEPTGNKIMIFTNNLGQQQRVVLTPAQQKMFMQQNSNKLKTATVTTTTTASKIVKANPRPNILAHPKAQLISSTSSGQTILLAPTQIITPLTPQQMKTATKVVPTKLKLTKYIHGSASINLQHSNLPSSKTIIFKNQQGHTVKKIQGTSPDADLDRQVAEQIEAIKAAEAVKNTVKPNQPVLATPKDAKLLKQMPVKKLVPPVKLQQQQPVQQQTVQQQRKSVVRKMFNESTRSLALANTTKVPSIVSGSVPPLTPLLQQTQLPNQEVLVSTALTSLPSSIHTSIATPQKNAALSASNTVNTSPEKDGEKRQLVMQDDQGNMSAIPVGQILAIPNETIDGQAQSYMLVTMDETGNLIPINQETLMSIDPNILGNMVVQNDQVSPKTELEVQKLIEKEPIPAAIPEEVTETVELSTPITEVQLPQPAPPDCSTSEQTILLTETPDTLLATEIPTNLHTTTCNINNGDVNKQVVITGDPIVTQKFLESLAGNQELFNLLANAEGNLLIHADGQQILINTSNTPVENSILDQPESSAEDRNPVMSNPSTKNHDILAAALADTDVIPSKLPLSQLSPGTSLYPLHSSNVLETSAMNSPIMTPLEVTETHCKKIDDILGQVPKNVSDLPITITDPNISHTVAQQQLSNDLSASLELPLSLPDNAATSAEMGSPSFPSYTLPNLDEDISQKSFGQSISMPLLTDESEEPIGTTEERTGTTDSLIDTSIKLDTTSTPSIMSTKEEYSLVDRMCSMRTSRICSSLSEPPPDMFDYTPEPTDGSEHPMHEGKGENDSLLQKVTAAMKKAIEDLPSTHSDNLFADSVVKVGDALTDIVVRGEHKLIDDLPVIESDKFTDSSDVDRVKTKEEFEPNLTPQFHSPSTNTDDSCEIPVQPPIVTALDDKLEHDAEMADSKLRIDGGESDVESRNCKLT